MMEKLKKDCVGCLYCGDFHCDCRFDWRFNYGGWFCFKIESKINS